MSWKDEFSEDDVRKELNFLNINYLSIDIDLMGDIEIICRDTINFWDLLRLRVQFKCDHVTVYPVVIDKLGMEEIAWEWKKNNQDSAKELHDAFGMDRSQFERFISGDEASPMAALRIELVWDKDPRPEEMMIRNAV